MAQQNTDKVLIGHAITANSILEKIEYISESTKDSISRIEEISKASLSVTAGLAASIKENTSILADIKEILLKKSISESAKIKGGSTMKNLMGLGGLIAVVGFGIFTLSLAFQSTRGITTKDIGMGTLILAGLVPMLYIVKDLLVDGAGTVFGAVKKMFKFAIGVSVIVGMVVATAYAMKAMPSVDGNSLLTFIAVSGALYIQGQIFIQLISAWAFSGLLNKFLNKNNTNEIMQAMVVMTLNTVIIAFAVSRMPNVGLKQALSFVIASAAMIPLAGALFVVRFALPMLQQIGKKEILMLGATMSVMAFALIPVGIAAKALGNLNISQADIDKVNSFIKILIPIAALVGFMTAITNLGKETLISLRGQKEEGASLLKQDNSRKRNQKMNLKGIGIFALKAVTYLAVGGLLAVGFAKAAPYLAQGISAMNGLDYEGLLKFIAIAGIAVLAFGAAIGLVVSMVKGKETETPGLLNIRGTAKSKPAKMSTADMIFAGLVIPIIITGIVAAALGFKLINAVGVPKVSLELLGFLAVAGLGILIFGTAMSLVTQLMRGRVSKGLFKGGRPGKMGMKDVLMAALVIPAIALGIVATAHVLRMLPLGLTYKNAPDPGWSLFSGLALLSFGITFALVTRALQKRKVGFKDIAKGTVAMVGIALAIVAVSYLFQALGGAWMSPPAEWSLKAGLSILAFGIGFAMVTRALQDRKVGFKDIAKGAVAVIGIAAAIVAVQFIFQALGGTWMSPPAEWSLKAGLSILAFGVSFALITTVIDKANLEFMDLVKGATAMVLTAVAITAIAWVFSWLDGTWMAPPVWWSIQAGITILAFGTAMVLIAVLMDKTKISYGSILKGAIGMIITAVAILAIAWILSVMPSTFVNVPMDWSIGVALALVAFTVPALIIGLIATSGVGAVGLLLGVVGMIVIAAGMLAVAWILSAMPDLGAISQNFTNALMTPINAIIDAFVRIKEEIGVKNILGLALGVAALGVAWLVFVASTAGASVVGGAGALIGGLLDGIAGLFGSDQPSPLEILEKLAQIAPKLTELASPLMDIAGAFLKFTTLASGGAIEKIGELFNAVLVPMDYATMAMLGVKDMSTYLDKLKDTMRHIAGSYGMIANHSKNMNVEAIKASTDMFNALAYLASVGKDDALSQLGDKLIQAVSELAMMIKDFEGTVATAGEENSKASSSIAGAAGDLVDKIGSFLGIGGGSSSPAPAAASNSDMDEVVDAINKLKTLLATEGIKINN